MLEIIEAAGLAVYGDAWRDAICGGAGWSRRFLNRVMSGKNEPPAYFGETVARVLEHAADLFGEFARDAPPDRAGQLLAMRHAAITGAYEIRRKGARESAISV